MVVTKRNSDSSSGGSPHGHDVEKTGYTATAHAGEEVAVAADGGINYGDNKHLHRGLKSRHITMIAIGGAIGTGLIIGTGKALAQSGCVILYSQLSADLTIAVLVLS
jgi:amino acid transporter